MSLDIFLANSQGDICQSTPHFSFQESDFIEMLNYAKPAKLYPNINQISDYYQDNVLNTSQVCQLINELKTINKTGSFSDLIIFLSQINGSRAYFFSD